jgi:hypothetical protein
MVIDEVDEVELIDLERMELLELLEIEVIDEALLDYDELTRQIVTDEIHLDEHDYGNLVQVDMHDEMLIQIIEHIEVVLDHDEVDELDDKHENLEYLL